MSEDKEPCPMEACGNEDMDDVSDNDDSLDWFCPWCGSLFMEDNGELVIQ